MENKNRKIVFDVIHTSDGYPVYWLYFKDQYGHGIDPDDLISCEYSMKSEMEDYIRDGYDFENHIVDFEEWLEELLEDIEETRRIDMIHDMVDNFNHILGEDLIKQLPCLKEFYYTSDTPDCPRLLMETILDNPIQGVEKDDFEHWIFTKIQDMGSSDFNTLIKEFYQWD